ncbi:MAG: hypothetical protein RH946_05460 [Rhodospirillales bacterium]
MPARLIRPMDIYELPRLSVQALLAWTLPERAWWPVTRLFGRFNTGLHPERTDEDAALLALGLAGTKHAAHVRDLAVELWSDRYEERFHCLRTLLPGGWHPSVEIKGAEHVEQARAEGKGVLFWSAVFAFSSLVDKMAWHRMGLPVSHFTRPEHGFSSTRFGIRYINWVRRDAEDKYLYERLMTPDDKTADTLAAIRERLTSGGVVSFMIGNSGRNTETVPFMSSQLTLATGPLAVARKTGAVVLPVCTLRTGPGRFETTIMPQVNTEPADSPDYFRTAVERYAAAITPFVDRDPGQWRGWGFTEPVQPAPSQ